MRHSTAVALLKSGVDLSSISQWLGHASLNTTNRYASVDLEMKRRAIARVKPIAQWWDRRMAQEPINSGMVGDALNCSVMWRSEP